jgi:hypothetical protein
MEDYEHWRARRLVTSLTTLTRDVSHVVSATHARADDRPGIPYRSMATLLREALDQAQLVTLPLARALTLDKRIGADLHWRRAERLQQRLIDEPQAELDALSIHERPATAILVEAGEQPNH